ncbi:MAG: helix-turn-helix transcriptional regulator [bacterium]
MSQLIKNPALVELGQKIREYRQKKGISQEKLALLAGLHRNYIGALERGEKNVSYTTILKILEVLEISFAELLGII